jgi:pyruvate dehydrogenase (quinone)
VALSHSLARQALGVVAATCARQELVMPPTTTFDEAPHFGMFMLKAVLDGRASQLIDLAKVNLTR